MLPKEPLYMPQMLPSGSNHATHPATDAAEGAAVHAAPEHQGARPPQLRLSSGGRYACGQVSARVQHRAPDGRQVSQLSIVSQNYNLPWKIRAPEWKIRAPNRL